MVDSISKNIKNKLHIFQYVDLDGDLDKTTLGTYQGGNTSIAIRF